MAAIVVVASEQKSSQPIKNQFQIDLRRLRPASLGKKKKKKLEKNPKSIAVDLERRNGRAERLGARFQ